MKLRSLIAAVLAVGLVPIEAGAANRATKAQQSESGLGMTLFLNGDFKGALGHFNAALAEAKGSAEIAQVHLLRGECFVAMGDQPDARKAFELALDQDADAKLDPDRSPPEMVSLLADVRKSLHAEITLLGQGASATLDGADLGPLPIHQQIPIGSHALEVATPDRGFDEKQQLEARPGDSIALTFDVPQAAKAQDAGVAAKAVSSASTPAPSSQASTSVEPSAGLDVFGTVGALIDPVNRGAAFEAGAGLGYHPFVGSISGIWGATGGLVPRVGVAFPKLLGPVGLYACAEVPLFIASGAQVGLGAQVGVSARFWIVEPYVGVSGQHFFSAPEAATPTNYLLVPAGVRVYLP